MILVDGSDILVSGDYILDYVTPPEEAPKYLRAVIHSLEDVRPLRSEIDLSTFDVVSLTTYDPLVITFPDTIGFPAFALKVGVPLMTSWYVDVLNNGAIGGDPFSVYQNLWPAPELMEYNGNIYRVYWSSYITQIKKPVEYGYK